MSVDLKPAALTGMVAWKLTVGGVPSGLLISERGDWYLNCGGVRHPLSVSSLDEARQAIQTPSPAVARWLKTVQGVRA